jgi:hypothetical protein
MNSVDDGIIIASRVRGGRQKIQMQQQRPPYMQQPQQMPYMQQPQQMPFMQMPYMTQQMPCMQQPQQMPYMQMPQQPRPPMHFASEVEIGPQYREGWSDDLASYSLMSHYRS